MIVLASVLSTFASVELIAAFVPFLTGSRRAGRLRRR
jgi:hypothetical protein